MSDRIELASMVFDVHVGAGDEERAMAQPIEIDLELELDLRPAGTSDDLAATVDYGLVFAACRELLETGAYNLLEAVAETVAGEVLGRFAPVDAVVVRVRKPGVPIDGVLDHAGVEITRRRPAGDRASS